MAEVLTFITFITALLFFESTRSLGLILLSGAIIFIVVMMISANSDKTERLKILEKAKQKLSDIVDKHINTLADRRDTLMRVDCYGVIDSGDWYKEVQHFIDNVVRPVLTDKEAQVVAGDGINSVFQSLIEDRVAEHCDIRQVPNEIPNDTSPLDFEGMCAAVLRQHGWEATTTKGTGDQGADVIAEHSGKKLVLQCKLYSGTVGNKAVQEVIAAKQFYSADIAAVVCKSDYTKSAKQLAQASGVKIMTYSELPAFAEHAAYEKSAALS